LTEKQLRAGDVDWSKHYCIPPVKNQGSCGSCWSFAVVAHAEVAQCLMTGKNIDYSEQQLVSCDNTSHGCKGGFPWSAIDYVVQTGLCTEADFPYTSGSSGTDGECQNNCNPTPIDIGQAVEFQGESDLQQVLDQQAVVIVVEAGNDVWKNYKGGVVQSCPGGQSDHAVMGVGYGTKDGVAHFKIQNSWGAKYGEGGFIYLQRGVGGNGMCNVAEHLSYGPMQKNPVPPPSPTPTEDPTDEEPTDEEPTDEEPTDEEPTDEEPTDEEPTDEEPTDEEPTDEEPTDEEPTDEEPTDEEPTDEEPTDEEPTDEEPTDEEPTDEEPTDEEPTPAPTTKKPTKRPTPKTPAPVN